MGDRELKSKIPLPAVELVLHADGVRKMFAYVSVDGDGQLFLYPETGGFPITEQALIKAALDVAARLLVPSASALRERYEAVLDFGRKEETSDG